MKKLRLVCVAMIFCLAAPANAQFNAILYSLFPLTDMCLDGTPLPDGTIVRIYWDNDANGPDPDDPQPPEGNCYACTNYNWFYLNGEAMFGIRGTFYAEEAFTIATNTPQPSLYYLRVAVNDLRWTSRVFTIANGLNEYDLSAGWACEIVAPDTCEQFYSTDFFWESLVRQPDDHRHYSGSYCLWLCANRPVVVQGFQADFGGPQWAFGTVTAGCGEYTSCNTGEIDPSAQPTWQDGTTTINMMNGFGWGTLGEPDTIVSPVDGWVCLFVDMFLPVEQGSFDAVSGDSEVRLHWNTLSETGVERFDLKRKDISEPEYILVASIAAANEASGAEYAFTDRDVINGQTYTYTLETVNLNGSREEWGVEVTATPGAQVITEYALRQNYPNPFNPTTRIEFDVLENNTVTLQVFNIKGQLVATPVNGTYPSGSHSVSFDASNLSSGVYFYTVNIGESFTDTKKMLLLK